MTSLAPFFSNLQNVYFWQPNKNNSENFQNNFFKLNGRIIESKSHAPENIQEAFLGLMTTFNSSKLQKLL